MGVLCHEFFFCIMCFFDRGYGDIHGSAPIYRHFTKNKVQTWRGFEHICIQLG